MLRRMKKSVLVVSLLALAATLALVAPAYAGGWVVITLDSLPENMVAGAPTTIGMMAHQHGVRAWVVEELAIQAEHVETGKLVEFKALPDGAPGHYTAELVLPEPGTWEWGISAGMFPDAQPMPDLEVAINAATVAGESTPAAAAEIFNLPSALLAVAALTAFAVGVVVIVRGWARRLPLLGGVGLMILCAVLAFASYSSATAQAKRAVPATGADQAFVDDPSAIGQQLFLAKGCVVCHTNDRVLQNSTKYGVNMGPNLTNYKNDPNYIHTVLKDPRAMNKAAQMPQLDLKVHEIEALVAFINDHGE